MKGLCDGFKLSRYVNRDHSYDLAPYVDAVSNETVSHLRIPALLENILDGRQNSCHGSSNIMDLYMSCDYAGTRTRNMLGYDETGEGL